MGQIIHAFDTRKMKMIHRPSGIFCSKERSMDGIIIDP